MTALDRLPGAIDDVTAAAIDWSTHRTPADLLRLALFAERLATVSSLAVDEELLAERKTR